tara:strand:- start:2980 stop:3669 length:690 start_codon:yes stop_codon:yes gene_type:complete
MIKQNFSSDSNKAILWEILNLKISNVNIDEFEEIIHIQSQDIDETQSLEFYNKKFLSLYMEKIKKTKYPDFKNVGIKDYQKKVFNDEIKNSLEKVNQDFNSYQKKAPSEISFEDPKEDQLNLEEALDNLKKNRDLNISEIYQQPVSSLPEPEVLQIDHSSVKKIESEVMPKKVRWNDISEGKNNLKNFLSDTTIYSVNKEDNLSSKIDIILDKLLVIKNDILELKKTIK